MKKTLKREYKMYRVKWEIDVEASDEVEAATRARKIQMDSESIATVFDVKRFYGKKTIRVDLSNQE